jgi:hypothetical protein
MPMTYKISPRPPLVRALAMAGFVLAQMSGTSSNLGTPAITGTRTPESNPGTSMSSSESPSPGASTMAGANPAVSPPSLGTTSGPAYSFGAAPPPTISPNR